MKRYALLKKNKTLLFSIFVGVIYFLVVTFNLQGYPIKGIADQGDFKRIMVWVGVHYQSGDDDQKDFSWVYRFYNLGQPKIDTLFSSELLFTALARDVNVIFHPTIFDIKVLGIIHTLSCSFFIFLITYYLMKLNKYLLFVTLPFIFVVLTDSSYVAYFNSFYQEPAGFIFLLFFIAIFIKVITDKPNKNVLKNLILLVVAGALLISAKSQYFILFIPMIFSIYLLFYGRISNKILILVSVFLVIFSMGYYFIGTPTLVKRWNVYNTLFAEVLGNTANSQRAANIVGVDSAFLKYRGVPAHASGSGVYNDNLQKYLSVSTFFKVIKYYILTPGDFLNLSNELAKTSFTTTMNYLGYYEKSRFYGPVMQPQSFNVWEIVKERYIGRFSFLLPAFLIIGPIIFLITHFKNHNKLSILGFFISSSALSQFMIILVSEGSISADKHLLLFDILFDLMLLYLATYSILIVGRIIISIYNIAPGDHTVI